MEAVKQATELAKEVEDLHDLHADQHSLPQFVATAYILAILLWTFAGGFDFIDDGWKSIRKTRNHGMCHLLAMLPGFGYMIFYAVLQTRGRTLKSGAADPDMKELVAAAVACFVTLFLITNTVMGLWQLSCYRAWAALMCKRMASRGYSFSQNVDDLLVNNTLIENSWFVREGAGGCFTFWKRVDIFKMWPFRLPWLKPLRTFFGKPLQLPWISLKLAPYDPAEAIVRWTVTFLACVGVDRIDEDGISRDSHLLRDLKLEKIDPNDDYKRLLNECAAEIWATADARVDRVRVIRGGGVGDDGDNDISSTMPLEEWRKTQLPVRVVALQDDVEGKERDEKEEREKVRLRVRDKVSPEYVLHAALRSGDGLPYRAPVETRAGDGAPSVDAYTSVVEEAIRDLPAQERYRVENDSLRVNLDVVKMFVILTFVSRWRAARPPAGREEGDGEQEARQAEKGLTLASFLRRTWKSVRAFVGKPFAVKLEATHVDSDGSIYPSVKSSDMPVELLKEQLGFDAKLELKPAHCALALPHRSFGPLCRGNRLLLEASVHVDIWLALVSGRQMKEYGLEDMTVPIGAEREDVRGQQRSLEAKRLGWHLAVANPEYQFRQMGISFLGCSMEHVRRFLARWRAEQKGEMDWVPAISTEACVSFAASSELVEAVSSSRNDSSTVEEHIAARVIFECQRCLYTIMSAVDSAPSPSRVELMMMCILSYPSLYVSWGVRASGTVESGVASHIDMCALRIVAVCGPQKMSVLVQVGGVENAGSMRLSADADGGDVFKWQLWKDGTEGRLAGFHEWQQKHGLPCASLRVNFDMSACSVAPLSGEMQNRGGVPLWQGWLSHRPKFAVYELVLSNLVVMDISLPQRVVSREVSTSRTVTYSTASGPTSGTAISSSHSMAREFLVKHSYFPDFATTPIGYADATLADVGRAALSLCDIAGVSGSEAASEADTAWYTAAGTPLAPPPAAAVDGTDVEACETLRRLKREYGRLLTEGDPGDRKLSYLDLVTSINEESYRLMGSNDHNPEQFQQILLHHHGRDDTIDAIAQHNTTMLHVFSIATCAARGVEVRVEAASFLGQCLESGVQSMRSEGEAICWYEIAILLRGSVAERHAGRKSCSLFSLGDLTRYSMLLNQLAELLGVAADPELQDVPRAAELYERAVAAGNFVAMYNLGRLLESGGDGVPANVPRAVQLYGLAVEAGNVDAWRNLGRLLESGGDGAPGDGDRDGDGAPLVTVHLASLTELYERVVASGDIVTMNNLARLFQSGGEGVPVNLVRTRELYERAAAAGDVVAMTNLALLLESGGEGVPANLRQAAGLFERAVAAGNDLAMVNLALLLESGGDGVPANLRRAAELYERAVAAGNDLAMVNLGL